MVGDGDSGKTAENGESTGSESEPVTPSSRRGHALVAAGVGEHTDSLHKAAVQSGGNAVRAALERDVHRFQAVSRHERLQRKKPRGRATAKVGSDTAATAGDAGAARVWTAQVSEAPADAEARSWDTGGGDSERGNWEPNALTGAAETTEHPQAKPGKRAGRGPRKPSAKTLETRRLLSVIAAEWNERVAAFGFPRREAPLKPYRPTDFAEAYALTAPERRALPKEQIRQLNVKAGPLVARGLAAAHVFDEWRDAMAQLPVDLRRVDQVGTYARAFSHADVLACTSFEVVLPDFAQPGETC